MNFVLLVRDYFHCKVMIYTRVGLPFVLWGRGGGMEICKFCSCLKVLASNITRFS